VVLELKFQVRAAPQICMRRISALTLCDDLKNAIFFVCQQILILLLLKLRLESQLNLRVCLRHLCCAVSWKKEGGDSHYCVMWPELLCG
jgi:hypothetical protein